MKRSFSTNVDGQIFYMDEDAFNLLQDYLHQLKVTFRGTEGEEIVSDIESRIRELFAEKIDSGSSVIVIEDVQKVIERMGRPEDLNGESVYTETEVTTESEAASGPQGATPPPLNEENTASTTHTFSFSIPSNGKKLFRSTKNRVFGGVFGGLAVYLGWNANIMRILYVALSFCLYFWPLVIIYLIAWMVIPEARTPRQLLEMYGEPVNVSTIGETVIRESSVTPPPVYPEEPSNGLGAFFRIIGNTIAVFFGLIAGITLFGLGIALIVMLVAVVSQVAFHFPNIFMSIGLDSMGWGTVAIICCSILLGIIIFGAILWGCCVLLFNASKASKSVMLAGIISAVVLIVAIVCLGLSVA